MEHQQEFYILSLYNGPNLLLHSTLSDDAAADALAPFIFKTRRDIEELKDYLTSAGAIVQQVEDKGFAYFLNFQDPFGLPWMVIREKR